MMLLDKLEYEPMTNEVRLTEVILQLVGIIKGVDNNRGGYGRGNLGIGNMHSRGQAD